MNILTFNYEYPPVGGGGGIAHELIAVELAAEHHVTVVTSGFEDLPSYEVRDGVEIHRVPVWRRHDRMVASISSMLTYPPAVWKLGLRLSRTTPYDVVHAHFAVPTGPGSLPVARLAGIPHVLTVHGGDIYDPSKRLSPHRRAPLRWAVRQALRRSDLVVAQSRNTAENTRRYYNFSGEIRIIPLAIRRPPFPAASRDALGLPTDRFLAVTVGRLIPRKGIDRLLRALTRPECENVYLVVVGAGPELEPMRMLAARLGVQDRVMWTGWAEEDRKWQILSVADAYVSSTRHEGYGLVFLEAMAAALPIVSPDHGGQVDFLSDGDTGFLVPEDQPEAMGPAIGRLVSDPDLRRRISQENLQRSRHHRLDTCAQAYEDVYRTVIGRAGNPSSRPADSGRSVGGVGNLPRDGVE